MSANHVVELVCDAPNCVEAYTFNTAYVGQARIRHARADATEHGWTHKLPFEDYCPKHRASGLKGEK